MPNRTHGPPSLLVCFMIGLMALTSSVTADDGDLDPPLLPDDLDGELHDQAYPPNVVGAQIDPESGDPPDRAASSAVAQDALYTNETTSGSLAIPIHLSDPIHFTTDEGQSISVTRQSVAPDSASGVEQLPGVAVFLDTSENTSSVVLDLSTEEQTAFAVLEVIDGPTGPQSFTYEMALPDGAVLVLRESGQVWLRTAGSEESQLLTAPWAYDADSRPVPVRYQVDGNSLTMLVDHDIEGQWSYPIVADPCWKCIKEVAIGVVKTVGGVAAGTTAFAAGTVAVVTFNPVAAALVVPLARLSIGLTRSGISDLKKAGESRRRYGR